MHLPIMSWSTVSNIPSTTASFPLPQISSPLCVHTYTLQSVLLICTRYLSKLLVGNSFHLLSLLPLPAFSTKNVVLFQSLGSSSSFFCWFLSLVFCVNVVLIYNSDILTKKSLHPLHPGYIWCSLVFSQTPP